MTKNRLSNAIFFCLFFANIAVAYIDAGIVMNLVGNRQVILIFDAYKGYGAELNLAHANIIAGAIKNLALENAEQQIDFSYEDPSVYDAGSLLKAKLPLLKPHAMTEVKEKFLSLTQPIAGLPKFDIQLFKKPPMLSTYLAGDLTRVLALVDKFPKNLTVRSNDPRREHYIALTKGKTWLKENQKTIRMRNLMTASPLLKAKRALFQIDTELSIQQQNKLTGLFDELAETEKSQLEAFSNFISIKRNEDLNESELDKTIDQLKNKISLDDVHEFLIDTKRQIDIYADAPVVDILLTMFNRNHPDKMVIILGNHLATRLTKFLADMGVIESGGDINRASEYFARLALKNL